MSLKFNPPKNVARYAYAIEYEKSQTKFDTYNDLGAAKNALQHKTRYRNSDLKVAYILENVAGSWYVLYTYNKGDQHWPWQKPVTVGGWRNGGYTVHRAVPLTRDEYAEWRVAVERERIAEEQGSRLVKTFTQTNSLGD